MLAGEFFAEQIFHVADLFAEEVQLAGQALDFGFGAPVHMKSSSPRRRSLVSWRFWLIMMMGAWMAASMDKNRFSRMKG